jgi:hypothetical protein
MCSTGEQHEPSGLKFSRRRFTFWLGFGLFSLAEKLRANGLDELAAATMRATDSASATIESSTPIHWRATGNRSWRWYERESLIDGQWTLTGITAPINKKTGQPYAGKKVYLDDSLVPPEVRISDPQASADLLTDAGAEHEKIHPDPLRRARHGRPPSKWLRSLNADEIRIWLKTIDVPEAGVSGMTYWTHLTRDHSFAPARIVGLTIAEQAKLHAAAHYGY